MIQKMFHTLLNITTKQRKQKKFYLIFMFHMWTFSYHILLISFFSSELTKLLVMDTSTTNLHHRIKKIIKTNKQARHKKQRYVVP